MAKPTSLHLDELLREDKRAWMNTARIKGVPFQQWVHDQLNAGVIDANPPGLRGLSEYTRVRLLAAGFANRADIQQAVAFGFDLRQLGRRCERELSEWL